ncbi:MAG: EAL domain-containing protein [Candidatus Eremiobacteraeota bacterium]|nr:EAL domain-containing protein [Candidatus Eremiobacteraeota bacterium]
MSSAPFGLENVFSHLPVSVWTTDSELRITYVGESARALGLREGDVVGQTAINCVLDNRTNPGIADAFARAKKGERASFRTMWRNRWYFSRIEPLRDESDRIVGTVGAALDVTAETPRASGYRETDSALEIAQRLAGVGSWRLDFNSRTVEVSPEFGDMTGRLFTPDATFDAIFDIIYVEDRARFLAAFEESRATRMPYDLQHRIVRADGVVRDVRARGTFAYEGDEPRSAVGTLLDITDQIALDRVLSQMTYHDALTGLPNEALLRDRLTRSIARAQRSQSMVAVCAMQIDNFPDITDTLGLAIGDQFLIEMSRRLNDVVRPSDTVARRGGNEFIMILPDIREPAQVNSVLKRVRESLRKPLAGEGHEVMVTASAGISVYPTDGHETEVLLRSCVNALHRSIEEGAGNFRYFSDAMHHAVVTRLRIDQSLRLAVEQGRFEVSYQPIFSLPSKAFWGFEALLRWPSADEDKIDPKTFIPLAEDNGLIAALGEHVLQCSLAHVKALQKTHSEPIHLNVNVSARQFVDPSFPVTLKRVVDESGVDPGILELELTESALIRDMEMTAVHLRQIRELGIGVAIDDFGTGYNSLFYLKNLPITTLKIDSVFIHDVGKDKNSEAIIMAIISLAHQLNVRVVGEGVETQEQLAFLEKAGCEACQGFLFGPTLGGEAAQTIPLRVAG